MKEIKTTDYVSEYEFRRATGPKYQASSLRPVIQERKRNTDNDGGTLPKRSTIFPEQGTRQSRRNMQWGEEHARNGIGNGQKQTAQRIFNDMPDEGDRNIGDLTGSKQDNFCSETNGTKIRNGYLKKREKNGYGREVISVGGNGRKRKKKSDKKADQKVGKKSSPKVAKKATSSLKSAIADMQKSANASWDTDQRWDEASSWDFASEGASSAKGFKKGIEEVIKVIVKVIKAVATTTLLPLILIMTCCLFIVITVLWASSDVSVSGAGKADRIENPTTDKQVIYNGLLETFEGNETAVYGVMCALMAESGCSPTATEATSKWGISAADYTAQVNDGTVSKEEFINSTYNGVQGSRGYGIAQWSTTGRKKALYEFAESWAMEKGETFDIGGIDMQVAHLQETINTSYASMKESLIKEKDMVKACYLWNATYEKPSEKYSTWQEKAERDVRNYAEDLRTECSVSIGQGMFL